MGAVEGGMVAWRHQGSRRLLLTVRVAIVVALSLSTFALVPNPRRVTAHAKRLGTWTPISVMHVARSSDRAIVLLGHAIQATNLSNADHGKPHTGRWAPTGEMTTPHGQFAMATLLSDGRVLVAGGFVHYSDIPDAELYNPRTGQWTPTGQMTTPRGQFAAATLLPSGKVLVVGPCGLPHCSNAELYDPHTGRWAPTGSVPVMRGLATLTRLRDGRVLFAGGVDLSSTSSGVGPPYLYDPRTSRWTATSNMLAARSQHTATLLRTGQVLVTGGMSGGLMSSAELYNPQTHTWTATGAMATPRSGHKAVLLTSGHVLVVGGEGPSCPSGRPPCSRSAELYNPTTGTWTRTGSITTPNCKSYDITSITALRDGAALVTGITIPCTPTTQDAKDHTHPLVLQRRIMGQGVKAHAHAARAGVA